MGRRFVTYKNQIDGLVELMSKAPTFRDNLLTRIDEPIVGGANTQNHILGSRTIIVYGGQHEKGKYRFKVDREFPVEKLSQIISSYPRPCNHCAPTDQDVYEKSEGTEFIITPNGTASRVNRDACSTASGCFGRPCIINNPNIPLNPSKSDLWLEATVARNHASPQEYKGARQLLVDFGSEYTYLRPYSEAGLYFFVAMPARPSISCISLMPLIHNYYADARGFRSGRGSSFVLNE